MKKLYILFIVIIFIIFACNNDTEENNTITDISNIADVSNGESGSYSTPITGSEIYIIQRDEVEKEISSVLNGKYRDWISVDEIKSGINARVGGDLIDEESIEKILHEILYNKKDLYFGIWESLDSNHYPPDGWDRIFAIPTDGKLLMKLNN